MTLAADDTLALALEITPATAPVTMLVRNEKPAARMPRPAKTRARGQTLA
jgi:hypothetical protein